MHFTDQINEKLEGLSLVNQFLTKQNILIQVSCDNDDEYDDGDVHPYCIMFG